MVLTEPFSPFATKNQKPITKGTGVFGMSDNLAPTPPHQFKSLETIIDILNEAGGTVVSEGRLFDIVYTLSKADELDDWKPKFEDAKKGIASKEIGELLLTGQKLGMLKIEKTQFDNKIIVALKKKKAQDTKRCKAVLLMAFAEVWILRIVVDSLRVWDKASSQTEGWTIQEQVHMHRTMATCFYNVIYKLLPKLPSLDD
jgi:hypothetical protein